MLRKILILLFLTSCLLLNGCIDRTNQKASSKELQSELTLKQAIELAYSDAITWNKNAKLIDATSIDNDKTPKGEDGKRRYWNITFGLPNSKDLYLVNIHDGKVNEHAVFANEGDKPRPESYFITDLSEIKYDTPELLKKAKKITKLYPGNVFAKGYNFGITKDPGKNIILVKIIGWDKERKNMKYLMFDGKTGKLHNEFEKEQYKQ